MKRSFWTIVVVGVTTFLLGELALRVYNPIYVPVRADQIQLPVNRVFTQTNLNNKDVDRELVNSYNGLGLRGPEYPADPEKHIKIFTVGGSTTACVTLTDGRTWPDQVLKQLRERFGPGIWLNNAGIDGHSTFGHQILLDTHLARYRPDYIIYLVGINDMGREDLNEYDSGLTLNDLSLRNRIVASSELLSTAQALYRSYRAFDMGLNHAVDHDLKHIKAASMAPDAVVAHLREHKDRHAQGFERRMRSLIERTIAIQAVPILVTQPAMMGRGTDPTSGVAIDNLAYEDGLPSSVVWDALEIYNDVTRRLAAEYRVPLIDAAREMPKDSALYFDWIHYSNPGAERMADIVSRGVAPVLSARQSAPEKTR